MALHEDGILRRIAALEQVARSHHEKTEGYVAPGAADDVQHVKDTIDELVARLAGSCDSNADCPDDYYCDLARRICRPKPELDT